MVKISNMRLNTNSGVFKGGNYAMAPFGENQRQIQCEDIFYDLKKFLLSTFDPLQKSSKCY